jgi:hypothetical protein
LLPLSSGVLWLGRGSKHNSIQGVRCYFVSTGR